MKSKEMLLILKKLWQKLFAKNKTDEINLDEVPTDPLIDELKVNLEFDEVMPGDVVVAKIPDLYNNNSPRDHGSYLIIKKSDEDLHGIYVTTKEKYEDNNRYSNGISKINGKKVYYKCNCIYKLSRNDFIRKHHTISKYRYQKVLDNVVRYSDNPELIDFKSTGFTAQKGSVVMINKDFYLITNQVDDNNYRAFKLKESKNSGIYILLFRKKYVADFEREMIINQSDVDAVICNNAGNYTEYFKNNEIITKKDENYDFGDVITIKKLKNRVIYITSTENKVYYVTFDALDFFTGISTVAKDQVIAKVGTLDEKDKFALAQRINKRLDNENYVPSQIMNKVSSLVLKK